MNDDLGQPQPSVHRIVRKSSLVYTLAETLHDAAALAYFVQFMEGIGQLNLIKFWLHLESFRSSALITKETDGASIAMIKNDARLIYSKYMSEDAPCSIGITDSLRKLVTEQINVKNGTFDPYCFSEAQKFVFDIMDKRYFKEFESSVYYAKHRLDVISSGSLTLHDIMLCQPLLCAFIEYMENEGEKKLVEFIISVETFAEQLPLTQSDEQAVEDAMIIYNRYFSMQATEPLKFGSKTRNQIESDICAVNGRPASGCFEVARRIASNILEKKYLKRFYASPAFVKYLQNLMAQVESNIELPNPNKGGRTRANSSDQSSDMSLPPSVYYKVAYRTLTRFGSSDSTTPLSMGSEEDERTSQTDSLSSCGTNVARCVRPRANISLATIDDMGRYRPLYDNSYSISENMRNTRRKLKNKLKNYLHYSIKKEAEVADQVAQLIIADVHSMISAGSSSSRSDF